ncbi:MAG: FMN-dependent NADH-azoreductase [Pedobacter sp.]|uniref:FMN-dependent NADH-azoreductase n=1 Tax=Pedobacter sp. TaxID=1411316 RepID=UPI003398DF66
MKKILHIISSPRGESSVSIKLGNAIIDQIKETYPGSTVIERNLVTQHFPHLEESHLQSFFTPKENHSPENTAAIKHSNEALSEIFDADIIVIGAPLYNFSIHSALKAWIDHIARAGITFKYDENGPEGLIKNKKVYIAMSSGGIYSEGPMEAFDFVVPYLKAVLGFLGLTDISVVRVEGTNMAGMAEEAMEKGLNSIVID